MREMNASRTLSQQPLPLGDTSIPWEASLVQPERMLKGSVQVVVVDVSGPRLLEGVVRIHVGTEVGTGEWEDQTGQRRRCHAPIRPSVPGVHRVLVEVAAGGGEAPLLDAGKLIVTTP
jgi:hypothetical protein